MNATDFEYDGQCLRDFGMVIGYMGSSNSDIVSIGSELNWNTIPVRNGALYLTTTPTYDNVIETTFYIFKIRCGGSQDIEALTIEEQRSLNRWLNRKEPHLLHIISKDPVYTYAYFEGSFNLSKIESAGKTVGYELHFISNRPFAIGEPIKKKIIADTSNYVYEFTDYSDEIGYIYPKTLTIVCKTNGDLTIKNSIEERSTEIYDCETNEIITFDDSLSFSSDSREIQNAFNYVFFRIANTYTNRVNRLEISIPCEITFEYIPIIKGVGL